MVLKWFICFFKIRVLIGFGFRAAVQAKRIADPVAAVLHGHTAPLVAVLVLVHMLIGDTQNVQTQSGGPAHPAQDAV